MPRLIIDFETASKCPLKVSGAAVYSEHPSTEVLCLVFTVENSGLFYAWSPFIPELRDLSWLIALASDPANIFVSHAMFEQFIWRNIMEPLGCPPLPPERWEDTQATAYWKSLPGALEKLLQVLGLSVQKDMAGRDVTLALSKPLTMADWERRYPGPVWGTKAAWKREYPQDYYDRTEATIRRVIEYCVTDVAGEEATLHAVGDLSPGERQVWLLDQRINHRGIRVDLDFVYHAQKIVDIETAELTEEFLDLTGGIRPGQRDRIIEWCGSQGVALDSLKKEYLTELLGGSDDEDPEDAGYESLAYDGNEPITSRDDGYALPAAVRRALVVRSVLGSASIKKLAKLQSCVCEDGRGRGFLQYHAAHPGRWGGRLLQPQNFPRGVLKVNPEYAVEGIMSGDPRYLRGIIRGHAEQLSWSGNADHLEYLEAVDKLSAIEMVGSSLRHALIPDSGKVFMVGDFAGIEMRVDLALARQFDKCDLLASGSDVYSDMAVRIYNLKPIRESQKLKGTKEWYAEVYGVTTAQRTIGKNTVLGCGFQMGPPKFHARYCPKQELSFAQQVVRSYRQDWAPNVVEFWKGLHWAVNTCIREGKRVVVYGCTFSIDGYFMRIDLPNGWQTIWYYQPAMQWRNGRNGRQGEYQPSYKAMKAGKWLTVFLYGGIICENLSQALARGLLVEAMMRMEYRESWPLVLSVHDEAVCEVWEKDADRKRFKAVMEERSDWVKTLQIPIAVEEYVDTRYKK